MKDGAFLDYLGYGYGQDIKERKIRFPFKRSNSDNIPFHDNFFDVVVMLETLEHISDLEATLKEIKRVLKVRGVFLMSTPSNNLLWRSIWSFWRKTFGVEWKDAHTIKYKEKEWLKILSKYFKIEETKYFYKLLLVVRMRNTK